MTNKEAINKLKKISEEHYNPEFRQVAKVVSTNYDRAVNLLRNGKKENVKKFLDEH